VGGERAVSSEILAHLTLKNFERERNSGIVKEGPDWGPEKLRRGLGLGKKGALASWTCPAAPSLKKGRG